MPGYGNVLAPQPLDYGGAQNVLAAPALAGPQNVLNYAQPSDDDEWMATMRERLGRNLPYAQPGPYTTQLPPAQEQQFQQWVAQNKVPFNPRDQVSDYDMRGYYRDIASKGQSETARNANDGRMHFPDTYKTPYHQSFSAESQYAKPNAPIWINDHQLADPTTGRVVWDERPGR